MIAARDLFVIGSNIALAVGELLALQIIRKQQGRGPNSALTTILAVAASLTVADLVWEGIEESAIPLQSLRHSFLWFALVVLLSAEATHRMARTCWGPAILLPVAFAVQTVALFFPEWFASREALGALGNKLSALHVGMFLVAYAALLVSAGCSLVFLIVDRRLKATGKLVAVRGATGLARLDEMATRAAGIGALILMLSIALSLVLLLLLAPVRGWAALAVFATDFTIWSSFLIWLYFVAYLVLRSRLGWVGRRGSLAIVIGAVMMVAFYFGGKLLPRGALHGYAAQHSVEKEPR